MKLSWRSGKTSGLSRKGSMPGKGEGITNVLVQKATGESKCSSLCLRPFAPRKCIPFSIGINHSWP